MQDASMKIFAERLKKLRETKGLSTRALGEIIGTSNASISRYETGQRIPDVQVAREIAKYFNVTIEYLCGEDIKTDEENLIKTYSKLSEPTKQEAIKYITYLYEKEREFK